MSGSQNQIVSTSSQSTDTSYIQRAIDITFILGKGSFGESGQNTVTLSGLRVSTTILVRGAPSFSQAQARVYGVNEDTMNKVSRIGAPVTKERDNLVTIQAGNLGSPLATVFQGNLQTCYQDLNAQPETYLFVEGMPGLFNNAKPTAPISFTGVGDVATMMAGLAVKANLKLENNNVNVKLSNPYYSGTVIEQINKLAADAQIGMKIDNDILAIWPLNGSRGGVIPVISPESGLIGYPQWSDQGIKFRTLFNPSLRFGGQIEMKSNLTLANGLWYIQQVTYDLTSQYPGGPWFCDVEAALQQGTPKA